MASLAKFKTDTSLENNGVWIPAGDGLELKIARMNNPKYVEYIRVKGQHLRAICAATNSTPPEMIPIIRGAVASTILLDWKGLNDEAGKPIEYSPEVASKVFDEYPEFYGLVLKLADEPNNFREAMKEVASGN